MIEPGAPDQTDAVDGHDGHDDGESGRWRTPLLAAVALFILAITLWPLGDSNLPYAAYCVLCGARGLADAILNVVVFVPLGMLLAYRRHPLAAVLAGVAFSVAIEAAQIVVPGRYPSPGDILFNGLGTALGVGLYAARGWLLDDSSDDASVPRRTVLATAAAALAAGVLFLSGWLLAPVPGGGPYYAEWEPEVPGSAEYDGRVVGAAVGRVQARPGPLAGAAAMGTLLAQGAPIGVAAFAAGPPDDTAPLLVITDADGNDVVTLGVDGPDAVFYERVRATTWRLVTPGMRMRDAFAGTEAGDTLQLATFRGPDGLCFDVQRRRECGYAYSPGSGWSLLHDVRPPSREAALALNSVWLALLMVPVGFFARPRTAAVLLIALVWYMAIRLPFDTVLAAATWPEMAGSAAGVLTGFMVRKTVSRGRDPT